MKRLLLMTTAALALTACEYKEVVREIGYKGKARVNPWLAAERFTGHMGYETKSVISWTAPGSEDAVWMIPAAILSNESFIRQTGEWVREGGHLILLIEYAEAETNDWSGDPAPPILEPPLLSLLEQAGLSLKERDDVTAETISFDDTTFQVNARSEFSIATGEEESGVFASVDSGDGRITVLTDGRLFRNRWIDENDNAALLDALIAATEYEGAVGFMRGSGLSLWALLREHLWPVLIGLGVWLLLWLWKNLTRFGPIEAADAPSELRGYEHHLEALGDFQWRLDRTASLLTPLREQIVELGQRTSVRAGRRDDDFFQFLADRAGLPRERVFRALAEAAPADSAILTRTAADLQQLLKALNHPSSP